MIIDFADAEGPEWVVVNDGVMGGVSQSRVRRASEETAVFEGTLSLENNGGFASVRALVGTLDLSSEAGLEIRVRGDGRRYQLRLRTEDRFDGAAYRAEFQPGEDWQTIRIPFDAFEPVFRGRILKDAPPLDTENIEQLGIMLADKRAGPFALEIRWIGAYTGDPPDPERADP